MSTSALRRTIQGPTSETKEHTHAGMHTNTRAQHHAATDSQQHARLVGAALESFDLVAGAG